MNTITISVAFYMLLFWGAYRFLKNQQAFTKKDSISHTVFFVAFFMVATAGKIWLSQSFFGHSSDMSLFSAWADLGRHEPISAFYGTKGAEYYVDYPPLYLYVLTMVGKLAGLFSVPFGSRAYIGLIKCIPILADTATALLVYKLAKGVFSKRTAKVLAILVLLNPAYILNSVFWGQIDGLYTLLILWLVYSVFKKRYIQAILSFTAGMLTKPQMIIFLPLLGFWLLRDVVTEWKTMRSIDSLKQALWGIGFSVILVVVAVVPMFGLRFDRFFSLYINAAKQYPYATLNAANVFGAFGQNWADVSKTFLGISHASWGFIGVILTSLAVFAGAFFAQDRTGVLILSGFSVLSIFMVAHTMHERYMFPLILILLVLFLYTRDRRVLYAFLVATVLQVVQMGLVLLDNEGMIVLSKQSFVALSWVHILFFACMLFLWYKMLFRDERKCLEPDQLKILYIEKDEGTVRCTRKDIALIAIITLVYSVSAFFHLGSFSVPEKGVYLQENNETVILDFGKEQYFDRVNLFLGWIDRRMADGEVERAITVSFGINAAEEGETKELIFGDETVLTVRSVFRWDGFFANQHGRYVKISADEGGFFLNEVACFDKNKALLSPVAVYGEYGDASALTDEQEKAVYAYTWYDGTYFDEVYHPRTAYEYLNGLWPYENTHPPLGKGIISLGMLLFGVTPFGWRFFGALCGVFMVPVAYLFGKQLFKQRTWAAVSCFLFTFDFMHLTQTRLATIDSFTVLFVMLSYYFMYRYTKLNFYNKGVRHTLLPLFFSGLFFGLGTAVKWQGIYGGAGLCVLFFHSLFKRYSEYKAAKEGRLVGDSAYIIKQFFKNTIKTLAAACMFFLLVPAAIYVLSYLPIVLSDAADITYIWENQNTMFSYHTELTQTHVYGSPWWSWPLDLRPLYAYSPNWDFVSGEYAQGISSFGNPLIWWCTIPAIGYLLYRTAKGRANAETNLILMGFGAMYLPWILITRQAFIYHFFPCVIFVVLAITYAMKDLCARTMYGKRVLKGYLVCVFLLYVAFYPVLTGIQIPFWYAEALSWLPGWVLG